jgi:hypothetical protein
VIQLQEPFRVSRPGEAFQRESETRQAATDKASAEARDYVGAHAREQQAIAEAERRTAEGELDARVRAAIDERKLSVASPEVPGTGWASSELRRTIAAAAWDARLHFTTLVHAEREIEVAKKELGATLASPILSRPASRLTELREQLDLCEARFEYALGVFKEHCARLRDPAFVAMLDELNACAETALFTPYVTAGDPEMTVVANAVRALHDACSRVAQRQAAKLQEHSHATRLAKELGFTREQIGEESYRSIQPWLGQSTVQRAAKAAADAWRREHGELDISGWLPNWDSPYG